MATRRSPALYNAADAYLRKAARATSFPRGYFPSRLIGPGNLPRDRDPGSFPGSMSLRYGEAPQPNQVYEFLQMKGLQPTDAERVRAIMAHRATAALPPTPPLAPAVPSASTSTISGLFNDYQAKLNEANAANQARYDEGLWNAYDLRDRNQDRVGNWGYAAQQDIDERMREQLSNTAANLAQRGLANSNVYDSFAERNARDTAREQQRVSEMRDDRLARYDTTDTGAINQWIYNRVDSGPDPNQSVSLALKLAEAQAADQARTDATEDARIKARRDALERRRKVLTSVPRFGPTSRPPVWLNGTPQEAALAAFGMRPSYVTPQQAQAAAQGGLPWEAVGAPEQQVMQSTISDIRNDPDWYLANGTAGQKRVAAEIIARRKRKKARQDAGFTKGDANRAIYNDLLRQRREGRLDIHIGSF